MPTKTLENQVTIFNLQTRQETVISLSDLIDPLQNQFPVLPSQSKMSKQWKAYWKWRKQERQQVIEKYLDQFVLLFHEAEEVLGNLSVSHFIEAFGKDLGYSGFRGGNSYRRARRYYWILRAEMRQREQTQQI